MLFATAFAVSAKSSAPQAAMAAIACLTSQDSQMQLLEAAVDVMRMPTRRSMQDYLKIKEGPAVYEAYSSAWSATPYNWGPYHQAVDAAIQQALERVYQGRMTVEESFAQAANEIRTTLRQ